MMGGRRTGGQAAPALASETPWPIQGLPRLLPPPPPPPALSLFLPFPL